MMPAADASASELARSEWDVIVIGTGIGGATLGHRLAAAGKRVLFCEKGRSHLTAAGSVAGAYPELHAGANGAVLDRRHLDLLRSAGRYTDELVDQSTRRSRSSVPFIGAGTGGSSALYGMALERFLPADFRPRANHPAATGSSLEDAWPVSYEALAPYYAAAETLYHVRGGVDPLRRAPGGAPSLPAAPALTSGGADLFAFLQSKDLHPYRLPMACEFVPGCEGCQGFLCARDCKNDSARVCLAPSLANFGAVLLDECEVLGIEANRTRVNSVVCDRRGERLQLRGKIIVLAAGALQTPGILLRSRGADWPDGLANQSGRVGRNLMRHFVDLYLIEPAQQDLPAFDNRFKELAFNDFYQRDGIKLGSVQSFGRLPPAPMLFGSLQQDVKDGAVGWLAPMLSLARPFMLPVLRRLVTRTTALATTMEDLPYLDNRVFVPASAPLGSAALAFNYRIRPEATGRIAHFRNLMRGTLSARKWRRIIQAENNQRIAHVCGTCRFGLDPKTSVLDETNRAHGLENLYVVDSSFFPSSGGTNPSLTIAANALRVADLLGR